MHPIRVLVRLLRHERAGASAVELGLLLPVAFALLLALLDLGRLGFVMATLEDAAQEGAQFASRRGPESLAPASDAQVEEYVRARIHGADRSEVRVFVRWPEANSVDPTVAITVEHTFAFLANLFPMPTLPMRGTARMPVL